MGMYIYVTSDDIKKMKTINSNKELNEELQEALKIDPSLLIGEISYYKKKKGHKGWLLGEKEKHFRYTLYHESPAFDGTPYQAVHMFSASKDLSTIFSYLFGIINGGNVVHKMYEQNKNKEKH